MKSMLYATTIGLALAFSVVGSAAARNSPMPVLYRAVKNGPTYPVLARKGNRYFQVFVYAKGQPYFTDAAGQWHFVSGGSGGETFPMYYVSGQGSAPVAVPQGKSDEDVKTVLLSGGAGVRDRLVCWGGYGWYSYDYVPYASYCYYGSYAYGYGYNGASYYGGYNGYNGYNGNGYNGNGYNGYYGYGQPAYYNGYGCVLNGWYW